MIRGAFANDRRLVSMLVARGEERHAEKIRAKGTKQWSYVVAINAECVRPREIQNTCVLDFSKIIAMERREAAGSIRAVYNRRLKLALQQVILVHAIYPRNRYPRNFEFRLETANHAPEIVMFVIVCV